MSFIVFPERVQITNLDVLYGSNLGSIAWTSAGALSCFFFLRILFASAISKHSLNMEMTACTTGTAVFYSLHYILVYGIRVYELCERDQSNEEEEACGEQRVDLELEHEREHIEHGALGLHQRLRLARRLEAVAAAELLQPQPRLPRVCAHHSQPQ